MHTIGSHLEFIFVRTNLHSYYGFSNPCSCSVYFEKFLNQRTTYFWTLSQIISGWFLAEGEINSWRFHRNSEWFSDPGQNTGFIVHPWTSFHGRLWQKENNISWGNTSAFPQMDVDIHASVLLHCTYHRWCNVYAEPTWLDQLAKRPHKYSPPPVSAQNIPTWATAQEV